MSNSKDIQYMRAAFNQARSALGRTAPNPAVGCVIVNNGIVVGLGRTGDGGRPHAETQALRMAGARAEGATAYVTLEPCSHTGETGPCAQALIDAGIKRCVIACGDPNPAVNGAGVRMLEHAGIEVKTGICENEALDLNKGFFSVIQKGRPFVMLKQAVSADRKISEKTGVRSNISGSFAYQMTHQWRSQFDAVMVGVGTVLVDDPVLTTRIDGYEHKPTRIVLDTHLRISESAVLVEGAQETSLWVFHNSDNAQKIASLEERGVRCFKSSMDLAEIMREIAAAGITRLFVEGGAKISQSLFDAGLVDEYLLYEAAHEIGGAGVPALIRDNLDDVLKSFSCQREIVMGPDVVRHYIKKEI